VEKLNHTNIESLNRDFNGALERWQKDNTLENATRINELIERGGGDYADFVLKIPARVVGRKGKDGCAITLGMATKYGKKEGKLWVFDIQGQRSLGIKVMINHTEHYLALKHKGDGPVGYFREKEIESITAV
jgi:hypothetical protein